MLTAISLYTGAGGLDLGFEAAGFSTRACVEINTDARKTLLKNRPQWGLLDTGDIHAVSPREIMRAAGIRRRQLDVVIAGPPCQPFSKSAFWSNGSTARLRDPRAKTLDALLDLVDAALPRAVVIENVRGVALSNKDDVVAKIRRRLGQINSNERTKFRLSVVALNAIEYGVPQLRERVFMVATRDGEEFSAPPPSHFAPEIAQADQQPYRTAWDAIGDITNTHSENELCIKGKWAELLPSIPEGKNYLHHTSKGEGLPLFGWRTKYWSFLLKLAKDQPSWTLQANPGPATGPFHWKNRMLAVREMCRLQTFPDGYVIHGDYRSARQQLGNAVPPALAEAVGKKLREVLIATPFTGHLSLATKARPGCPPPEPAGKVPRHFRALAGDYAPHPGTGLGPRAATLVDDVTVEA